MKINTNYQTLKLGDVEEDSYIYYIGFLKVLFGHMNGAKFIILSEISTAEFIEFSVASLLLT